MDKMVYNLSRHVTYRIARLHARLDAQATEILKTTQNNNAWLARLLARPADLPSRPAWLARPARLARPPRP